jgi:hypothetical protein
MCLSFPAARRAIVDSEPVPEPISSAPKPIPRGTGQFVSDTHTDAAPSEDERPPHWINVTKVSLIFSS